MGIDYGEDGFLYEFGFCHGGVGFCQSEKLREHPVQKFYRLRMLDSSFLVDWLGADVWRRDSLFRFERFVDAPRRG